MASLHLKILEALNPHSESCCCPERDDCRCCGAGGMQDAASIVRAVLDLHRSEPVGTFLGEQPPLFCLECSRGYNEEAWPCPTVREIARLLGIEVRNA